MANEVQKRNEALPAHLAQYAKTAVGNVDHTDQIIPRIKLLQGTSPENDSFDDAKPGIFWHNVADVPLGKTILGIPIITRKSYVLWAPRNDDRGILARAMDGIHWDQPDAKFTVRPKNSDRDVTYQMAATVAESGLDKFGSSIPGDVNSVPAASLTYNTLWYFPELEGYSPAIIINTRSAVKPMQTLLSKIDSKPVAHYCQLYDIGIIQQHGAEGPFFNYSYSGAGFADEETCKLTKEFYDRFSDVNWRASDETADTDEETRGRASEERKVNPEMAGKF